MQKMRLFGQELFEATFTGNVRDKFRESLAEANRKHEGLRIRLRISEVPELANMPWEFMYDTGLSRFLTLSIETPLVRYLDVPRDIQPLTIQPPLHILVVIASPRNFPTLNVQREWENLREALQGLENRGLVKLTRLERPTLQALQRQLRRGEYHIFHFIGHGVFSKHLQDGQLLFEDEIKGGDPVSSRDLGIILHDHKQLRLAVLNACEGARTSLEDQFSGTAQSLMLQGLPAVIAMQFRITDIAAITMAREFYSALADGYPVDASLTEARKSIKTHGNELEWGTPVLYMRSPDGAIFDVKNLPPRTPATKTVSSLDLDTVKRMTVLYTEGLEAFYLKEWERAISKFRAIIDEQPDYKDAVTKLEIAQKSLNLASLDNQAKTAETDGNWETAVKVLEKITKQFPEQDAFSQRLKHAQKQKRLSNLYDEARQLAQAKKWGTVVHVFKEIHSQDPQYPDPENLLVQAEEANEAEKTQRELEALYRNALEAIGAKNWSVAQQNLQQIQSRQKEYRETERLLKNVNLEIERIEKKEEEKEKVASLYVQAENLTDRKQWQKALDKIEEIQRIQPDFDDPKQIKLRAKTELEKVYQEEEKQNHLAELYAQAVKLNHDGEYQQALETWNQIRALDSTYPDKQKVYATAQGVLKKLARNDGQSNWIVWTRDFHPNWGILAIGTILFFIRFGTLWLTNIWYENGVIDFTANSFITWILFGILVGVLNIYIYRFLKFDISLKNSLILVAGWVISSMAVPITLTIFPEFVHRFLIGSTLAGALYGLLLHLTLPDIKPRPKPRTLILGIAFGMFVGNLSWTWFSNVADFNSQLTGAFTLFVATIISGYYAFEKPGLASTVQPELGLEKKALLLAGILFLAKWLSNVTGVYIEDTILYPIDINWDNAPYVMVNLRLVLFAIFAAWSITRFFKSNMVPLTEKDVLLLAISWIPGMVATSFIGLYFGNDLGYEWGWRLGWLTGGLFWGLGIWLATRKYQTQPVLIYLISTILIWAGSFLTIVMFDPQLGDFFSQIFRDSLGREIADFISPGIAGLFAGLYTLNQLKMSSNKHHINWSAVLVAILGFSLGNLLVNIIFQSYDELSHVQIFIWGLISGVSLAVFSKDYKHYLLLGALGGLGLLIGFQVYLFSNGPFYELCVGGVLGLFLGLTTKDIPRAVIMTLISFVAFVVRGILSYFLLELFDYPEWQLVLYALSAGVAGAIIGATWNFLNSADDRSLLSESEA
ncbi:MAG: CHAT domain-containing protein [Anaerolineales bacterium]